LDNRFQKLATFVQNVFYTLLKAVLLTPLTTKALPTKLIEPSGSLFIRSRIFSLILLFLECKTQPYFYFRQSDFDICI